MTLRSMPSTAHLARAQRLDAIVSATGVGEGQGGHFCFAHMLLSCHARPDDWRAAHCVPLDEVRAQPAFGATDARDRFSPRTCDDRGRARRARARDLERGEHRVQDGRHRHRQLDLASVVRQGRLAAAVARAVQPLRRHRPRDRLALADPADAVFARRHRSTRTRSANSFAAAIAMPAWRRARSTAARSSSPARRSSAKMPAPSTSCSPTKPGNSSAPRPATSSKAGSPRTARARWRCRKRATPASCTPTSAAAPPSWR